MVVVVVVAVVVVVVVVVVDDPVVGLGCEDWERCMGRKVSGQESKSYLHIAEMKYKFNTDYFLCLIA